MMIIVFYQFGRLEMTVVITNTTTTHKEKQNKISTGCWYINCHE